MELIKLTDNVYVNPGNIDSVQLRRVKGKTSLVVTVNGKVFYSTMDPSMFMTQIKNAGITPYEQFFSG